MPSWKFPDACIYNIQYYTNTYNWMLDVCFCRKYFSKDKKNPGKRAKLDTNPKKKWDLQLFGKSSSGSVGTSFL
jgi:hypothetical protein